MATLVSIREAAERSTTSYQHIGYLVRHKKITGHKSGNVWLVELESLKAYEEEMQRLGTKKHSSKQE